MTASWGGMGVMWGKNVVFVFIRDSRFLEKTLRIFKEHPKAGMIGMIGGIGIPENGVVYTAWNVGKVDCREPDLSYVLLCGPNQTKDQIVDAVDGLLMMTQYDLERGSVFGF